MVPLARHLGGGSPVAIRSEGTRRDPPSAAGWGCWAWASESHRGASRAGLAPSSPPTCSQESAGLPLRCPQPPGLPGVLVREGLSSPPWGLNSGSGPSPQARLGASAPGPPAAWRKSGKQLPKPPLAPGHCLLS